MTTHDAPVREVDEALVSPKTITQAKRLHTRWTNVEALDARIQSMATYRHAQQAADALVDFLDANGLAQTRFDPRMRNS